MADVATLSPPAKSPSLAPSPSPTPSLAPSPPPLRHHDHKRKQIHDDRGIEKKHCTQDKQPLHCLTVPSPSPSASPSPSPSSPSPSPSPSPPPLSASEYIETVRDALDAWPDMCDRVKGKALALFLDYDGTLTPIVENPSKAIITDSTRAIVDNLSQIDGVYTAIVTGRSISTIHTFMRLPHLHYAGSHGFDIRGPHDERLHTVAEHTIPALKTVYKSLTQACQQYEGALVEDNHFSLSVHYRNVDPSHHPAMESLVDSAVTSHHDALRKTHGKMVWEIRPKVEWHKGKAVQYLMDHMVPEQRRPAVPVYLGDDVTDEDAFRTLHELDKDALTVFVRPPNKIRPTSAHYVLSSTDDVATFLSKLCTCLQEEKRPRKEHTHNNHITHHPHSSHHFNTPTNTHS